MEQNLANIKINIFNVLSFHNGRKWKQQEEEFEITQTHGDWQFTFKWLKIKGKDKTVSS